MPQSEYNQGAAHMRDIIIAILIGFQNGNGNKVESEEYQAYQNVMNTIEKNYGEFMKPIKL